VPEYAAKPGVAGASSLRSLIELKNKENKWAFYFHQLVMDSNS
jgi:hypothetical protein